MAIAGFRGQTQRGGEAVLPEWLVRIFRRTPAGIQASFLNTPQHVIVSAMEGMADDSIWGPDKINVPVLAILAKTPFWPADTEEFYRNIAPNLDFQMLDGVGHFLMMEKPKQFNDAVIAFLDKNSLLK